MQLSLEILKEICQLFVKNFPGKIKVYIFGSTARRLRKEKTEPTNPLDEIFGGTKNFSDEADTDFLFEVKTEIFEEYQSDCCQASVDFVDGMPFDPWSAYWDYYSPKKARFDAIINQIRTDQNSIKNITELLQGKIIDTLMLPFEWQKDKQILNAINNHDPEFSKKIINDMFLVFEK